MGREEGGANPFLDIKKHRASYECGFMRIGLSQKLKWPLIASFIDLPLSLQRLIIRNQGSFRLCLVINIILCTSLSFIDRSVYGCCFRFPFSCWWFQRTIFSGKRTIFFPAWTGFVGNNRDVIGLFLPVLWLHYISRDSILQDGMMHKVINVIYV